MKYAMLSHRGISFFVYPRKDARGVFYYRFSHGEENYHKSTKVTTRKEAISIAQEAIDKVLDSNASQSLTEGKESLIFSQVVSGYLEGRKTVLRPSTRRAVTLFFRWFSAEFNTLKINEISTPQFHGFLNRLHERVNPAKSYWRDILTRYNQFWKWCIETNLLPFNPMQGYPRPKTAEFNVYEEVVEDGEFNLLCAHLKAEDEFILRCMRYMGTYPQDWAYAVWENFYLKDNILHFYRKRGKNHLKFDMPLDGRIEGVVREIWKRKKPGQKMFWNGTEEQYQSWYYCLQKRVYKVWQHLGLKPKKLGAFRHTFITEAVDRGVPEDVLLKWLGYSQGSTVLRRVYVHRKSTSKYRFIPELHPT
jgi:hypothetical protein